ncbi:MAG: serine/threonine protein kinase [Limisphaerales bacterium]
MADIHQEETEAYAGSTTLTPLHEVHGGEEGERVPDPQMSELLSSYSGLLQRKQILYPVAFRFVGELGRGRQGVVFLALRHGARGCVTRHAIKVHNPGIYSSARSYWTDMGRIASQTSSMQSITSPNLVSRETYDEVSGIGYTQMEVIHGIDVNEFISGAHNERVQARLSERDWTRLFDVLFRRHSDGLRVQPGIAIYLMRMVLRGLEVLHRRGFIHGDVKPANIMIDRLGTVKLVDYGRALRADEGKPVLFGSPLYMAPEIHLWRPSRPHSDLYSVGMLGLVLMAGKRAITQRARSEKELLDFKLTLPDKLSELLPSYVSENVRFLNMLRRFLAPDPGNRFQDAQTAETDAEGLRAVHKQLTLSGKDSDYVREVAKFVEAVDLDFWRAMTVDL